MVERKPMSKKLRFEVFKRDSFKCQYCGQSAPDVVLHVDHINPVKRGGKNDILNLITSCQSCNLGKGARELSDNSVISKQVAQIQDLAERREQLELMLKWREGLQDLKGVQIDAIARQFGRGTGYSISESGKEAARKWLNKFSMQEILECVDISKDQYIEHKDGEVVKASVGKAWDYIPKICACRKAEKENPILRDINYIKAIVRNRCNYFNPVDCAIIMKEAVAVAMPVSEMMHIAKTCRHWTDWKDMMETLIEDIQGA